jgi:8-oxo-dGTP diphosphatase
MTRTTSPNILPQPRVGVGVLKEGTVLLGLRKGKHEDGTWGLPGGSLEYNEELEACAARETREEAGVEIINIRRGPFVNATRYAHGKHFLVVILLADWESGEPVVREPERFVEWRWVEWNKMPRPLFHPLQMLVNTGYRPK